VPRLIQRVHSLHSRLPLHPLSVFQLGWPPSCSDIRRSCRVLGSLWVNMAGLGVRKHDAAPFREHMQDTRAFIAQPGRQNVEIFLNPARVVDICVVPDRMEADID
jgi:hypothetical protein